MARPSIVARNHILNVNGVNVRIRDNFNVSHSRISPEGLIKVSGNVTIQRKQGDGLVFHPRKDTSGNWNIGNTVNLQVADQNGLLQSPYWLQDLHILKVPKWKKRQRTLTIELGDALTFFDRETPEGDYSKVDPVVGLPRWEVIQNLLQEADSRFTILAGPGSSLPTEIIRYPVDKNDRVSLIKQAGMLAFNSQEGPGFLYMLGPFQVGFFYYNDAIATPVKTFTFRDVTLEPEMIQPEEYVTPVEKLKVTGVRVDVRDINLTPDKCEQTFRPFTLPDGTTFQRKTLEVCTNTTIDSTGCVFTKCYTKGGILPGLLPLGIVQSGEDFKIGTSIKTTSTYSPVDGLLRERDIIEERGHTLIVNGNIVNHELKPYIRETSRYFYGQDKLLTKIETDYFHPTVIRPNGSLGLFDVFQNPFDEVADPYTFVGTVIEEWKEDDEEGFVHTVSLVLNADGTINPARPTREYFITFNPPGRTIGIRDNQQPPEAETKPKPYEIKQKNIDAECEIEPLYGSVFAQRERVINIRHAFSESQLQKAADFICSLHWGRALGMNFVTPLFDEYLTGLPIKRFDYVDEEGDQGAYVLEGQQFLQSNHSTIQETEAPFIGFVAGGVPTPPVTQVFKIPVLHEDIDTLQEWIDQNDNFADHLCISTGLNQGN